MLKKLDIPVGFICFILYVLALKAMVGLWVMQMVTGS